MPKRNNDDFLPEDDDPILDSLLSAESSSEDALNELELAMDECDDDFRDDIEAVYEALTDLHEKMHNLSKRRMRSR